MSQPSPDRRKAASVPPPVAVRLSRDAVKPPARHADHMCLGIPAQVVERQPDGLAKVDFGGVRRSVSIAFTPEVRPGDWVLVHVGFALAEIDEDEAQATLELLGEAVAAELKT
jgi:hydrogenase expression/formation protein HypC